MKSTDTSEKGLESIIVASNILSPERAREPQCSKLSQAFQKTVRSRERRVNEYDQNLPVRFRDRTETVARTHRQGDEVSS